MIIILDKVCNNLYATLLLSVTVCRKFLSFSLLTQEKLHSGPFNISIMRQLVHLNGAFLHVEYYRERPLNASSGKHGAECSVYTPWRTGPPISCLLSMLCQTHNVIMTLGRLVTSAQSIYLSIMPGLQQITHLRGSRHCLDRLRPLWQHLLLSDTCSRPSVSVCVWGGGEGRRAQLLPSCNFCNEHTPHLVLWLSN